MEPLLHQKEIAVDEAEIIGVVGDVDPPAILKLRAGRFGQVYFPIQQRPKPAMAVAVHAGGDPAGVIAAVREIVRREDADQPIFQLRKMEEILAAGRMPEKLAACLPGAFAAVALGAFACQSDWCYERLTRNTATSARRLGNAVIRRRPARQ